MVMWTLPNQCFCGEHRRGRGVRVVVSVMTRCDVHVLCCYACGDLNGCLTLRCNACVLFLCAAINLPNMLRSMIAICVVLSEDLILPELSHVLYGCNDSCVCFSGVVIS